MLVATQWSNHEDFGKSAMEHSEKVLKTSKTLFIILQDVSGFVFRPEVSKGKMPSGVEA